MSASAKEYRKQMRESCPFCNMNGRSDLVRRHILKAHSFTGELNTTNEMTKNYFYRLPDDERKILISYKAGIADRPETKSQHNILYCFECHQLDAFPYGGRIASQYYDKCKEHHCKEKQKRKARIITPKAEKGAGAGAPSPSPAPAPVVAPVRDIYEAMLSDVLENPAFLSYRKTIYQFYDDAVEPDPEDEDDEGSPATTGKEWLMGLLKFIPQSQKRLEDAETRITARFAETKEQQEAAIRELEREVACLNTTIREKTEHIDNLSRLLCKTAAEKTVIETENDRLKAQLKALKEQTE